MPRYVFKTKPYKHQVRALKKLLANGYGGALLMEPRTGKTKTTIDWMSILAQQGYRKALVVCPSRVMGVWDDELHVHSPLRVHTTIWDARSRREIPLPRDDGRYDLYVVVVNYEAFATPGHKLKSGRRSKSTGRFKTRQKVERWIGNDKAIGVLDESHKVKSPSGKASNMIVSMAYLFEKRAILTGTPVTKAKRIFDIYMQWRWLNPERFADVPTVADFKERYGRWTHRNGYPQFLGLREDTMGELVDRVHADAFAIKRSECFDMPPPKMRLIAVPLRASARVYDEMAEHMVAELKSGAIVEASIKLVQTLRLAQIAGGVAKTDDGVLRRIGREKIAALEPLYEESFEHDEKIVVAARFKADLNACVRTANEVAARLRIDVPVFQLRGGISRADADRWIKEFRAYDGAAVFVVQPQAAALGIDLSTATRMVWYSLTTSWVDYTQCMDRIALNPKQTEQIFLLGGAIELPGGGLTGGVDLMLYETLQEDGNVARAITTRPERLLRGDDPGDVAPL